MDIQTHYFRLNTTAELDQVISQIVAHTNTYNTIYIATFMHNTVMIHNLTSALEKKIPKLTIVHLPLARDEETLISLFSYSQLTYEELHDQELILSDVLLNKMYQENIVMQDQIVHNREELVKRYFTDPLTTLPNLYQLREDLQENENLTLIFINVDNFKLINDFYGYVVGDYILEALSQKLSKFVTNGTIYRTSGSQFAVTEPENFDFYALKEHLKTFVTAFKHVSFTYNNSYIYADLTFSSIPTAQREELFSKVSMAMNYATKNNLEFCIYEDQMEFKKHYEKNLSNSLNIRNAILSSGIVPYFQPIIDNKTDKIDKYESLSRLIDSEGNILEPDSFLAIAKTIKIYNEVTKTIINKTFDAFDTMDCEFSINLSLEDILNNDITSFIMEKLQQSSISSQVIFEIVESENIKDFEKISHFFTEIKRYGSKICIDNFGAGYSNFSYLARLQVDYLKIDGSLIRDIDKDNDALIIVETIVSFAKKLQIKTIAEHVHSSTVLAKVKQLGIDYSQGFLIDKPHPNLPE